MNLRPKAYRIEPQVFITLSATLTWFNAAKRVAKIVRCAADVGSQKSSQTIKSGRKSGRKLLPHEDT